MESLKIVVLAGGISTERDVSLVSGKGIYQALKEKGHQVILLDVFLGYPRKDWQYLFEQDIDWTKDIEAVGIANPDLEEIKSMRPEWEKDFFGPHVMDICKSADIVFMALHGDPGEDGRIQACFDLNGIRYTGSGPVSSAICMNKGISKDLFRQAGIPTPEGFLIKKGQESKKREPIYPCIVKACCGGSSVGCAIASNDEEYENAVQEAFKYDKEAVVEQFIEGREFSVAVVGGTAYPVIEIAPKDGFYDYEHKYQAGAAVETCPAQISAEDTEKLQRMAEEAFRVLRLENYARMDFMMDKNGDFYCLEANTLPGMTPTSLLPQEAAAIGISFPDLCELLVELSLGRE